jgi:hypothetical protein
MICDQRAGGCDAAARRRFQRRRELGIGVVAGEKQAGREASG